MREEEFYFGYFAEQENYEAQKELEEDEFILMMMMADNENNYDPIN
jgi:hypothetical protein